jgi:hypothetical protein
MNGLNGDINFLLLMMSIELKENLMSSITK